MPADWSAISQELSFWRRDGLQLRLWWRDDDAIAATPALERLHALSIRLSMPVHIAVVPKDADDSLVRFCGAAPNLVPVVHGWAHHNHAEPGQKKAEFGAARPDLEQDAAAGLARLSTLFGSDCLPVFVPPWNRIHESLLPKLPALGFAALSTYGPRKTAIAAPGLVQINTHLDPIDWRGSRSLVEESVLIDRLLTLLQDRRQGKTDNAEPLGILTHHLVHDAAIWGFTERCISHLQDGGALAQGRLTMEGHTA